ncbi:MAG: (2Fe-2S)-binding protein [Dethiosulfovibrio peptidovorans]|nr:MAG: (2Fe-2S)-binding protein [Dethiosulfovibrio peptidovorans]
MNIQLTVNDHFRSVEISPADRLLDLLRNMGLTSVKEGCSEGECGACTVIMDGRAVTSCTVMAFQAQDSEIITLEGLAPSGELDTIQQAFVDNDALQCGFCSPGMIMSIKALLMEKSNPTEEQARRAIEGNICRCTGYVPIVQAIMDAAERLRHAG